MELCHHCADPEGHSSPPCMLECPNHHLSQSLREEGRSVGEEGEGRGRRGGGRRESGRKVGKEEGRIYTWLRATAIMNHQYDDEPHTYKSGSHCPTRYAVWNDFLLFRISFNFWPWSSIPSTTFTSRTQDNHMTVQSRNTLS